MSGFVVGVGLAERGKGKLPVLGSPDTVERGGVPKSGWWFSAWCFEAMSSHGEA